MNIGQGNFQVLNPAQARPISNAMQEGIQRYLARQQIQQNNLQMPFVQQQAQSQLDTQGAQIDNLKQKAAMQAILNKFLPSSQEANIGLTDAQADYYRRGGPGMGVQQKLNQGVINQISQEHPDWDATKINQAASAYLDGSATLPDGTQLPSPSGLIKNMVDASNMKTDTSQGHNQRRFADTLETVFQSADKNVGGAFKFAGLAGKTKGGVEALKANMGENNPDYQAYLNFTRQDLPALASEILRTGGANSTDSQKAMAIQQVNPIAYDSNPRLAMEQWNYLKGLYGNIGKTLSKSITQRKSDLSRGENDVKNQGQSDSLQKGAIHDGYVFLGGNANDPKNWKLQ